MQTAAAHFVKPGDTLTYQFRGFTCTATVQLVNKSILPGHPFFLTSDEPRWRPCTVFQPTPETAEQLRHRMAAFGFRYPEE